MSVHSSSTRDALTRPEPPPGNPRFPLFDSCRALAALSVVLYHVGQIGRGNTDGPLRSVGSSLSIGVPIFFAISGFLLYRPFVAARLGGRPGPAIRDNARRRIVRIVPAYRVALTGLALLSGWTAVFGPDFWRYYGFAQIYDHRTFDGGMGVAWTLCIEMSFYIVLPLYASAAARRWGALSGRLAVAREARLLVGLALLSGAVRAVLGERYSYAYPAAMLPGTFIWFVPGMLLAVWSAAQADAPSRVSSLFVSRQGLRSWAIAAAAFAGVCFLCPARYVADDVFTPVFTFFLLAPAVVKRIDGPARLSSLPQIVLRNRVVMWFGLVSYPVYLYHATFMAWLEDHDAARVFPLNHWLGLAGTTLVLTTAVAAGSWYLLERPILRRAGARRRPASTPVPASPFGDVTLAHGPAPGPDGPIPVLPT